ncbi:MAG: Stk1 family PASTA domain-containing Ser/Thr kinase [Clostridiales bacterium]|nr:Stk1 family PASTA domain-containing Ser/Thr kinase [Clostridiales bacterium]
MIGKVLDNRYELVEFVGKGGMALVYRAVDRRTGHSVAVKVLRPEFSKDAEFLNRFDREAVAASKMSHHNIVNLLDVGQEGDMRYLVMEYVSGRTLKEVIQQNGRLPADLSAQIAIRILSALQHAHKNGIIHRDIKPQNILVDSEGHVKVSDFGIARVTGADTITTDDSVMGSVYYFSPEQANGKNVTFSSDLYSVGVVLYEMLTGQPPFDGETPVAVAMQHINGKARPIGEIRPDVPPAIVRVVEKAMEKKPEMRYQSALEMAQDLQRALQEPDGAWMEKSVSDQPLTSLVQPAAVQAGDGKKKAKPHWKWETWALTGILILAVLAGLALAGMRIYDTVVNATAAPYCVDETEDSARKLIERNDLICRVDRIPDAGVEAGRVITQSPEYGTSMRKGETVCITVSTGPEEKEVPKVVGASLEEARSIMERSGFTLLPLPERQLSPLDWDTVLTQIPKAGELEKSGSVVQVTLSGGSVILPNLVGKTQDEAMVIIQQLNLQLVPPIQVIPITDETQFNVVAAQLYRDADGVQYKTGDQVKEQTMVELAVFVSAETAQEQTGTEGTAQ